MFRSVLSVAAGYAAMAALVLAGFSVALVEPDLALHPGSTEVTTGWSVYALALGFVAAAVGGWVCRRVARSPRPVPVLVALVVVLGLGSAAMSYSRTGPSALAAERPLAGTDLPASGAWPNGDVPISTTTAERLKAARQPLGYAIAIPLIGSIGVVLGARRAK
jgi:MFS family permease